MFSTGNKGFAVITVLLMVVVLMSLIVAHFFLTNVEIRTTAAQADSSSGFYAAEAGLNLRGDQILSIFSSDNLPMGSSPTETDACVGSNRGSGDFACQEIEINERQVTSFVVEDPGNAAGGTLIRIPPNELFAGLNAIENRYSVFSKAEHPAQGHIEALLEMIFRSRVVPIFQFAAFYNKDLEINPGPNMTLNGRVHANGNMYLTSDGNTLSITGQVTVANRPGSDETTGLFRRRKDSDRCTGTVRVNDLGTGAGRELPCNGGSMLPQDPTLNQWNGQIQTGLETLTVPPLRSFEPGGEYWSKADLRVVLTLDAGGNPAAIEVRRAENKDAVDSFLTSRLMSCAPAPGSNPAYRSDNADRALETSNTFYNWREETRMRLLEVDVAGVLNCLHQYRNDFFGAGNGIDDTTHGGLVFFFTVEGPESTHDSNNYGIRLRNADDLAATTSGAPQIEGLTVVSDQAVYVQGHFNRNSSWRPASIIADSLNLLSERYDDDSGVAFADQRSYRTLGDRNALSTEVNAAFLAGTDVTGGHEGSAGHGGAYNGGLENYPRFHEDWGGQTLTYRGSFVSFDTPQRVAGAWCGTGGSGTYNPTNGNVSGKSGCNIYNAPGRNWQYDERFNNINELPPLSPNFVYLRQELFVRQFEQ